MIKHSGDLVSITDSKNQQVFTGYLLGCNEKVIIGIEQPFLADPESNILSNVEQIKHLSEDLFKENLDLWLDAESNYISFDAKKHTITVLKDNTSAFRASAQNDVYDFKKNKWGEKWHGRYGRPVPIDDNPLQPIKGIIIECLGSENVYFIANGLHCAVKACNLNGFIFPYSIGIGVYDIVSDPQNPDLVNAVLVKSFDANPRANLIASQIQKSEVA